MEITRLNILNINSLSGENVIDFTAAPLLNVGIFAITGDTGAGKTSILDAITLALYGKVHRNKSVEDVMTNGMAECRAEIDFIQKNTHYKAKWSLRRSRSKIDGKIQGAQRQISKYNPLNSEYEILAEKINDVQAKIEEITKLDFERFTRSVLLSQGDFSAFLKSKSHDKSILLEKITGTEIYSDISSAIFKRDKLEKIKLVKIEDEIGFIDLMEPSDIQLLNTELTELANNIKEEMVLLKKLDGQINIYNQIKKLSLEKIYSEKKLRDNDARSKAAENDIIKLKRYNDLLPLRSDIEIQRQLKKRSLELSNEKSSITDKIKAVIEVSAKHNVSHEELTIQRDRVLEKYLPLEKNYSYLVEQEVNITNLTKQIERLKSATTINLEKNKRLLSDDESLIKKKQDLYTKFEDLSQKIEDNKICAQLDIEIPLLKNHIAIYNQTITNSKLLKKEKEELELSIITLNKTLEEKTNLKNELSKNFNIDNTISYAQEIADLNKLILEEIDQLNILNTLKHHQSTYKSIILEQKTMLAKRESKAKEIAANSKLLVTGKTELAAIEKEHNRLQTIYQQQVEINKYQASRAMLKEGDTCPLCLSSEQPFRLETIKTYELEAEMAFNKSKKTLETIQNDIYTWRIEDSKFTSSLNELDKSAEIIAQKRKEALTHFEANNVGKYAIDFDFSIQIKALNAKLVEHKAAITSLEALQKKNERAKTTYLALEAEITQSTSNIELKQTQLENSLVSLKKLSVEVENQLEVMFKIVSPYSLILENIQDWATILERYNNKYKKLIEERESIKESLLKIDQSKVLIQEKLNQITIKIKSDKEAVVQFELELEGIQKDYKKLYVGDDVKKDFAGLQSQKNALDQKLKDIEILQQKAASSLQIYQEQIIEIDKNIILQKDQTQKHELKLTTALKRHGILDLDLSNLNLISKEKAASIQEKSEQLNKEKHILKDQIETLILKIKELMSSKKDTEDIDTLKIKHKEIEANIKDNNIRTGQVTEILIKQKLFAKKFKEKTTLLNLQKETSRHWSNLNDLIGSADGKKYRKYVQALTLQKLLIFANKHLQLFNERYFLTTNDKEELGMDIIDTIQANNMRSVHTLSGGETFLVSLALALGLSDIASKNTSIKSLFIDEGFGSLDEESLELILSALENLQTQGKTIGLISHVKSLKERISTQIFIKKSNSGNSSVQLIC